MSYLFFPVSVCLMHPTSLISQAVSETEFMRRIPIKKTSIPKTFYLPRPAMAPTLVYRCMHVSKKCQHHSVPFLNALEVTSNLKVILLGGLTSPRRTAELMQEATKLFHVAFPYPEMIYTYTGESK